MNNMEPSLDRYNLNQVAYDYCEILLDGILKGYLFHIFHELRFRWCNGMQLLLVLLRSYRCRLVYAMHPQHHPLPHPSVVKDAEDWSYWKSATARTYDECGCSRILCVTRIHSLWSG